MEYFLIIFINTITRDGLPVLFIGLVVINKFDFLHMILMSLLSNNLNIDQICGNCGAWESDPFEKGWLGNCPFDQMLYAFTKKCEVDRWIPKYDSRAIRWYRKYAEQGNSQAQYNLGLMYVKGYYVSYDVELAHMWFSLASYKGHADADKKIRALENKMTLLEIEKAQDLAKKWKPMK